MRVLAHMRTMKDAAVIEQLLEASASNPTA
jgi:hypothetical protein